MNAAGAMTQPPWAQSAARMLCGGSLWRYPMRCGGAMVNGFPDQWQQSHPCWIVDE